MKMDLLSRQQALDEHKMLVTTEEDSLKSLQNNEAQEDQSERLEEVQLSLQEEEMEKGVIERSVSTNDQELVQISESISQATAKKDEEQADLSDLVEKHRVLKSELEALQLENAGQTSEKDSCAEAKSSLQTRLEGQTNEVQSIQEQTGEKANELQTLDNSLNQLTSEGSDHQTLIASLTEVNQENYTHTEKQREHKISIGHLIRQATQKIEEQKME